MSDKVSASDFLDREVLPALYVRLDSAFPEFGWTRKGPKWEATIWPRGFPYEVEHEVPSRLVVYENRPWWIKVHGHAGVRFVEYVSGGRNPAGRDFIEAVRKLARLAQVDDTPLDRDLTEDDLEAERKREERRSALEITTAYGQEVLWSERGDRARTLLGARGFQEEDVRRLGFGLYLDAGEVAQTLKRGGADMPVAREAGLVWKAFEGYILIPWADAYGRPLTIYGRWHEQHAPEGKPKTIALPGEGTKASPLYYDRARAAGHREVVLVEGVFDAALLQVRGDTRVVATVAAQLSGGQVATLVRGRISTAWVCGDPDGGGDRGTVANVAALHRAGIDPYVVERLPDGLDPDEFVHKVGVDVWKARVSSAIPGAVFRVQQLLAGVTPGAADRERRHALDRVRDYLETLRGPRAPIDRDEVIRLVASRTGYSRQVVGESVVRGTTADVQSGAEPEPVVAPVCTLVTAAEVFRSAAFKTAQRTYATCISDLDDKIAGGIKARQLTVIAAPTGAGKTGLVGTIALDWAKRQIPILWCATELDNEEQTARIGAIEFHLRGLQATPDDFLALRIEPERGAEVLERLLFYPINIDTPDGDPFTIIANHARAIESATGQPPIIIVDYMQVLAVEDAEQRRVTVTKVATKLRQLARQLGAAVIGISSVSRAYYGKGSKKKNGDEEENPLDWLAAAKESGDIEYSAAVFCYLDTSEQVDRLGEAAARLIVAKSRRGTRGFVGLRFHGPSGAFKPAALALKTMGKQAKAHADDQKVLEYVRKYLSNRKNTEPLTKNKIRIAIDGMGVTKVDRAVLRLVDTGKLMFKDVTYRAGSRTRTDAGLFLVECVEVENDDGRG